MKTLLLIHGPNLNKLGQRDPEHYGSCTLRDIEQALKNKAGEHGYQLVAFQSNHEGQLIDCIQQMATESDGLIINPGALSHYSYALHDAIVDSRLPAIEVHLSNIKEREAWRAHSVIAPACIQAIYGKKLQGYIEAFEVLVHAH
jgi:3-dehydroquinate dehydratase-2